jgi:hypothetical protein
MSHRSLFPESKHTTVVANRSVFIPTPPERQTISSLISPSLIQPKLKNGAANERKEKGHILKIKYSKSTYNI